MPFNEVLTIKSTGGGSWQNDFAIKTKLSSEEVYAAGKTRAAALGDPADHVEATTAEVHQYHKVINYPAKTYPHGVFFLLNSQKAVVACSANTENFFGVDASSLLGKTFSELFQSPTKVSAALAAEDYFTVSPVVTKSKGGAASTVNIILQRGPNGVMADVEPLGDESAIESQVAAAKSAAGKFESCQTEQELCDQMTAVMKELWGWDRQLVWKFNDDDTSTMVSEKKNDTVKVPLAGLTMYGVDMPPNARLGFLHRTYSRTTADVSAAGVDLVTDERFIAPEDVSLQKSTLRQVHQCAVEQYGEWDTRSCATFAVIVQRRLWGLCLHSGTGPNPLPPFQVRMAMEQLTNAFALRCEPPIAPQASNLCPKNLISFPIFQ